MDKRFAGSSVHGVAEARVLERFGMFLSLQAFCIGVAVSIGCMLWLSHEFGGPSHIPALIELPGIALTNILDRVPDTVASSVVWPTGLLDMLEQVLDIYKCPSLHEYRLEIVHHSPLILHLRGFLAYGETTHLLKLA